mmetsp:Transcript_8879/g.13309  ORF Transcript_8879/g.13309 Transcript_8879/m.13309 type:complete len:312 (+) Transcript_8879:71-1006(+)
MGQKRRRPLRESKASKGPRTDDSHVESSSSKMNVEHSSDESGSESDGDIVLDGEMGSEQLSMTFEFNDMQDEYGDGVAKMLSFLLPHSQARELGEFVACQGEVGTAVVCEEGDDVFAYATVVPLPKLQSSCEPMGRLLGEVLGAVSGLGSRCEGAEELISCVSSTRSSQTGVYLHGRYLNLPLQLVEPLHQNLYDDIKWAASGSTTTTNESTDTADADVAVPSGEFASISMLLMIVECSLADAQQIKQGSCVSVTGSSSLVFSNFEDDIFFEEAVCAVLMRPTMSSKQVCVMLIPLASMPGCISKIGSLVQ